MKNQIKMTPETRHVKISHEHALLSKKELLTSQLNLIKIIKKIRAYKILRKKQFANRNKLKTELKNFLMLEYSGNIMLHYLMP